MDASSNPAASALLAEGAWVRRLARALVRDPELAEDVAQETLVAALEQGAVERASLRAWLAAVLRNRARRAYRSDDRRVARERAVARVEATDATDALVARAESHGRVVALVLALDEPYRSVLLQRYLEERTPTEIARRGGVPVATVKTRLQRGLTLLRDEVGDAEGDRRPAWLVALAGVPRGSELAAGVAAGGAIVTMKAPLIGVVGIALACLVGFGIHALSAGDALEPDGAHAGLVPLPGGAVEHATVATKQGGARSRAPVVVGDATAGPPDLSSAAETAQLTGVVLDTAGRPVADARIDAFFEPGATYFSRHESERTRECTAATDRNGRFALTLPAARAHAVEVHADGFAPALRTERTAGMELRIVLERAAALRGTVVDERDGAPVPGGCVRVFQGASMVEVPVDGAGRFSLDELVPGEVGLLARPELMATARHRSFEVEPEGTLEVTLEVAPGLTVSGRISDARTGLPIAGAEVVSGVGAWKRARSGDDGRYRLEGVEAVRRETLFVRAAGYAGAQVALDPARADELDVALERGRAVSGRVLDDGGTPVERGQVIAWTSPYFDGGGARDELCSSLDPHGGFRIEDLDPGLAYRLVVRAPGHATSYFPLAAGGSSAEDVDLGVLRLAPAGSLEGVVLASDGKGVRAMLELWPAEGEPAGGDPIGLRSLRSDARGVFAVGDLGAGRYELRANGEGFPPVRGIEVELAPGERRRGFEVRLPGGRSIQGMLRDEEGKPVSDALVWARPVEPAAGRTGTVHATSDARGWFELRELASVPHGLGVGRVDDWELRGGTFALDALFVERVEPGGVPMELTLRALDERVAGVVVDAEGEPLPRAYVWIARDGFGMGGGTLSDQEGRFELAVARGASVGLVARRTRHLAEGEGDMNVTELQMGLDVAPPELGEARLEGVRAGARDVVLRLRP